MGCAGSKLDDLPAVALCQKRTQFLADAIRHRYALADAHASYARSLRSVGASLHRLLDGASALPPPASPVLPLPTQRKGDPLPPSSSPLPAVHHQRHGHGHSHSGSHINFLSGSDSDSDSPLHSSGSSPPHHLHRDVEPDAEPEVGPTTYTNLSYARNHPTASSVSYEQPPPPPQSHYSGYSYPYSYPPPDQSPPSSSSYPSYSYPYAYSSYGGFFGSSSPPPVVMTPPPQAASSSKAPPPPPPPPSSSSWDFLNVFESYDNYYPTYTPSRSSKEVREEEGIPDLEDEEHEVVKEAYSDHQKFVDTSSPGKAPAAKVEEIGGLAEEPPYKRGPSEVEDEDEAPVVEKNVVADEVLQSDDRRSAAAPLANLRKYHGISDVAGEIKTQFEKASDTVDELSKMLEVGKLLYHQKNSVIHVSKMMCLMGPSTSQNDELLVYEEDKAMGSGNLSSTLQKLYIWEKKLYEEVMTEEKLRVLRERKVKRLKHLDERGAEAHKVDSTQVEIRKLSTKIRIAIQVVESISKRINKLRDEELWPQINELIQGFVRMWKAMLECHRIQCHAISEVKSLESIASGGKLSDALMDLMLQLELELLEWIGNFSAWVIAQKNYVKALNGWLILCLHYEPEETADGIAPFSPGRLGAPPVFVICNYWAQALDRISEREVVDAMNAFAMNVKYLWEQQNFEQRQRLVAANDIDRWSRTRDRETQTINRAFDALNKKLVLVSGQDGAPVYGQIVSQAHDMEIKGMQLGLRQIFETMENFTGCTVKAYEELNARAEEERTARDNAKLS
ncbi:Transcription factor IIS N-terminal protein [Dioscorea alata]|uniref:Transcription factor IIS N-terminal protein n=1 Tax=Dioscorea alata TaxID=55571 RepID=A0ACB7WPU9_DIOAL|nr:Transcription factor IIS N-terminal protein [Dioscorea alata]